MVRRTLGWLGEPSADQAEAAVRRLRAAACDVPLCPASAGPFLDPNRDRPARPGNLEADEYRAPLRADDGRDARLAGGNARAGLRSWSARERPPGMDVGL